MLPSGTSISTKGISVKYPELKDNNKRKYILLDSAGLETPIKKDDISKLRVSIEDNKDNELENHSEENIKEEKELKTEKEEKEEIKSEFEKFDKNCMIIIDKKIRTKASEIENKIINFAKNLDEQAKDYLVMKFSDKIEKKKLMTYLVI